jgi:hypothetical protein
MKKIRYPNPLREVSVSYGTDTAPEIHVRGDDGARLDPWDMWKLNFLRKLLDTWMPGPAPWVPYEPWDHPVMHFKETVQPAGAWDRLPWQRAKLAKAVRQIFALMAFCAAIGSAVSCGQGPTAPRWPDPACPQCTPQQGPGTVPSLAPTPRPTPPPRDGGR